MFSLHIHSILIDSGQYSHKYRLTRFKIKWLVLEEKRFETDFLEKRDHAV